MLENKRVQKLRVFWISTTYFRVSTVIEFISHSSVTPCWELPPSQEVTKTLTIFLNSTANKSFEMEYDSSQIVWTLEISTTVYSALTMKGQNIGSSTKKSYKQIFCSDIMDSNKWKYRSLRSFKSYTHCSIAKNW